eukprot:2641696-Ditylum_brightwellii.AAC.1
MMHLHDVVYNYMMHIPYLPITCCCVPLEGIGDATAVAIALSFSSSSSSSSVKAFSGGKDTVDRSFNIPPLVKVGAEASRISLFKFLDRSFCKSNNASTRLAACAGIIVIPSNIEVPTTNRPCEVMGTISPNPTVVRVVKPKYSAAK